MASKLGFAAGLALIAVGLSMLVINPVFEKGGGLLLLLAGFMLTGLSRVAGSKR